MCLFSCSMVPVLSMRQANGYSQRFVQPDGTFGLRSTTRSQTTSARAKKWEAEAVPLLELGSQFQCPRVQARRVVQFKPRSKQACCPPLSSSHVPPVGEGHWRPRRAEGAGRCGLCPGHPMIGVWRGPCRNHPSSTSHLTARLASTTTNPFTPNPRFQSP